MSVTSIIAKFSMSLRTLLFKIRGLPSILFLFHNQFNKFNNTRARTLDSIFHMILRLL